MKGDKKLNETFVMAEGVPGYLGHVGRPIAEVYDFGRTVRCRRCEVRRAQAEFQLHKVQFRRHLDSPEWREVNRQVWETYQSRSSAVNAVKMYEDIYCEAVREDLLDQLDRKRIEDAWERVEEIEGPEL
jgi:hypothetical protein